MTGSARGRWRVLAVASLALAAVVALAPGIGRAEPVVQTGWWYRDVPFSDSGSGAEAAMTAQAAHVATPARLTGAAAQPGQEVPTPTLPPPPAPVPTIPPVVTVPDPGGTPTPSATPEGGLLVAADPTGVRAMAAVRFAVAPEAGEATLELTLVPGSLSVGSVQACPALSDWLPGADQPWSDRPAHDCDRFAISGSLSADGTTMRWTLPEGFHTAGSEVFDILLVPTGGDGTPFQVAFEKPTADAFEVTGAFSPPPPPPDIPLPDDVPPPATDFSPDGFSFTPPDDFAVDDLPGVDLDGQPVTESGDNTPLRRLTRALENPTTRRVATFALLLIGAYSMWQSNGSLGRRPRLLGALGAAGAAGTAVIESPPAPRGIGRFHRTRTGPPNRF